MFNKLLIANRGEIACRITRTAHRLGIPVVAVHSDVDRNALHVDIADEAVEIGGARPSESYLNADRIVSAAQKTGADAIHPGYGFLSENSVLAQLCERNSIEFIGPPSQAIRDMASKSTASGIAQRAGVPTLTGYRDAEQSPDGMIQASRKIGFPVLLKSSAGGGGRGMRIVHSEDQFHQILQSAKSEAKEAFDDEFMIIEKFLQQARHIEVQIAGDKHGNVVHLFDRECSAQRRYQKIIEEAPAPNIPDKVKSDMFDAAVELSRSIGYHGVGTLEFLLDGEQFYFMEMNTRLQVEHPVTEQVTKTDLVEWQLRIAAGESVLSFPLPEQPIGHSVEVRLYAENPTRNFLPSPGRITHLSFPETNDDIQIHTGVRAGDNVDRHYDPLIAKVVSYRPDRDDAILTMLNALRKLRIAGVDTNLAFLAKLLGHDSFRHGTIDVRFVESNLPELTQENQDLPDEIAAVTALYLDSLSTESSQRNPGRPDSDPYSPWHCTSGWRLNTTREFSTHFEFGDRVVSVTIQDQNGKVLVNCDSGQMTVHHHTISDNTITAELDRGSWEVTVARLDNSVVAFHNFSRYELMPTEKISVASAPTAKSGSLTAPLPGRVVRILVESGEQVQAGQNLIVIEAMKMEHHITSPSDGVVTAINYNENDQVEEGATCVVVETAETSEETQK